MKMRLDFRKATVKDIDELEKVLLEISNPIQDKEKAKRIIERTLKDEDKYFLIAIDKESNKIVGTMLGILFDDICDAGRPILLIENVAVLAAYQRMGIGRRMFKEIEDWARMRDCNYEILVSGNERTSAHKFYPSIGFKEEKGFKKYL